ncbi:MAG: hypothetical protein GY903_01350 [Fuerstiella sp.]|nr:hypothetical protein [Fuerstiella sp.]
MNTLREVLQAPPPTSVDEQLQILDDIVRCQKFHQVMRDGEGTTKLFQAAYGTKWNGATSDWSLLQDTVDWVNGGVEQKLHSQFRKIRGRFKGKSETISERTGEIRNLLAELPRQVKKIIDRLKLQVKRQFGVGDVGDLPLSQLQEWIDTAREKTEISLGLVHSAYSWLQ